VADLAPRASRADEAQRRRLASDPIVAAAGGRLPPNSCPIHLPGSSSAAPPCLAAPHRDNPAMAGRAPSPREHRTPATLLAKGLAAAFLGGAHKLPRGPSPAAARWWREGRGGGSARVAPT